MSKTTFERGKTITYPSFYPKLSFTPIFGRNGDFIWVEEVKAAWPEQDDEFTFVRSTVHDQRVDSIKEENAKLRELVYDMLQDEERGHNDELTFDEHVERANELGVRLDG